MLTVRFINSTYFVQHLLCVLSAKKYRRERNNVAALEGFHSSAEDSKGTSGDVPRGHRGTLGSAEKK